MQAFRFPKSYTLARRQALLFLCLAALLPFLAGFAYPPSEDSTDPLMLDWSSRELGYTKSIAWGDWDGDGDLDLAVGNIGFYYDGDPNRVYANEDGNLILVWSADEESHTSSVAWGDYDNDGDLDLAVGNGGGSQAQPNRVYVNEDTDEGRTLKLAWTSDEMDDTRSVAWGDWDGDGDLDLAVGNSVGSEVGSEPQPNRVYANEGGTLTLAWSSTERDDTHSIAWGDCDGDGDLDLAVGNVPVWNPTTREYEISGYNRVYANEDGNLTLIWSSVEMDLTYSIAWGDYDNDGDLDLAVGNRGANRIYANEGEVGICGIWTPEWISPEEDWTRSIIWGDRNGDGDIDLFVGNSNGSVEPQPNRVYDNDSGTLTLAWSSDEKDGTQSIALGDLDGDGDPDLAVGNGDHVPQSNQVYTNNNSEILTLAWSSDEKGWSQQHSLGGLGWRRRPGPCCRKMGRESSVFQ